MSIKEQRVPASVEALREELKKHPAIYADASLGKTFEECLARIATSCNIVVDGYYDVDDICDMLVHALKKGNTLVLHSEQSTPIVSAQGELILPPEFQKKKPTVN